ncbi:MAG: phage major capsid protein [Terrisporobacter sp.]
MSLKKIIRKKNLEKRELLKTVKSINDADKLKEINKQVDSINEEIYLLEDELYERDNTIEGEHFVEGGEQRAQGNLNLITTYNNIGANSKSRAKNEQLNLDDNFSKGDILGDLGIRSGDVFSLSNKGSAEKRNLDLGKYVRGIVTGEWNDAELEQRAMTTSATGVLIPDELSRQIINASRSQSLFTLANVPIINMDSDNITIARIKNTPTLKFKEEGKEASESGFELEPLKLTSKTAYGYAYVSIEAIRSSKNLSQILNQVFSEALADCIDKAMLYGQYNSQNSTYDNFAPSGIMNDKLIHEVVSSGASYDDFIKAIGKIKTSNGQASAYSINCDTEEKLALLKTTDGQYLSKPKSIENLIEITSNQLSKDDSLGSDALMFDPNAMVIGMQERLNIKMFDNTDECIKKGLIGFRVYSMLDCVVTRPNHICKIKGIK